MIEHWHSIWSQCLLFRLVNAVFSFLSTHFTVTITFLFYVLAHILPCVFFFLLPSFNSLVYTLQIVFDTPNDLRLLFSDGFIFKSLWHNINQTIFVHVRLANWPRTNVCKERNLKINLNQKHTISDTFINLKHEGINHDVTIKIIVLFDKNALEAVARPHTLYKHTRAMCAYSIVECFEQYEYSWWTVIATGKYLNTIRFTAKIAKQRIKKTNSKNATHTHESAFYVYTSRRKCLWSTYVN